MVDETVAVLVDHVEGLLELLDLVLVEHGEDVGGGALGALLGAPASGRLAARHVGGLVLYRIKKGHSYDLMTRIVKKIEMWGYGLMD